MRLARNLAGLLLSGLIAGAGARAGARQPSEPTRSDIEDNAQGPTEPAEPPPAWWDRAIAIRVESSPLGASVLLNGYRIVDAHRSPLMTPCEIPHVAPGEYVVELLGHDDRYARRTVQIKTPSEVFHFPLQGKSRHRWSKRDPESIPVSRVDSRLPIPPEASTEARLSALRELFGPALRLEAIRSKEGLASGHLAFRHFRQGAMSLFAPIAGNWSVTQRVLSGRHPLVSQVVCLVPWIPDRLKVFGRVHSDAVLELNLYDPVCNRYSGTAAVGRIHFGRMGRSAKSDWVEVSSGEIPGHAEYGFRFPEGAQEVTLELRSRRLKGSVSTDRRTLSMRGKVRSGPLPGAVYVGFGGGRDNALVIHQLKVDGRIDLHSVETDILVGMGEAFWGQGRYVTLRYYSGGHFTRLLVNGEVIAQSSVLPVWMPMARMIWRASVFLKHGDVIGFELGDVDDESSLFVVGVDVETSRVVLATHPMVWRAVWGEFDDAWYDTFDLGEDHLPRIGNGDQENAIGRYRQELHMGFPGLSLAGLPTESPDGHRDWGFKYRVR